MSALATVDDVKRILRLSDVSTVRDAQLSAALDAVESWAEQALSHVTVKGEQVEKFYDIYEDATLELPTLDGEVTKVEVFEYPSSPGTPLSPIEPGLGQGYDVTENGRLILRPTLLMSPFEGAVATRALRVYGRVEVTYDASGIVPVAVREGVAYLAAGYWRTGPQMLANLNSERIGDYAYSVSGGGVDADHSPRYVTQAMWLLTPYLRRSRIMVT